MPIDNDVNDSNQVSGFSIANRITKGGEEDNKSNSKSSARVIVNTAEDKEEWQHNTEKLIIKLAMGGVIFLQTILLCYAIFGWIRAYKRAKQALKQLHAAQNGLLNAQNIPPAGMRGPVRENPRRSRSRRDEKRINPGPINVTNYTAGPGVAIPSYESPPTYTNIVC
jgi:hypothetical protein